MFDQIKPLLDSGIINEDTSRAINEAFESKLNEARDQIRAELREEYARRHEHDRIVMVEAVDKMITEGLQNEISEFQTERRLMNEDRVRTQKQLRESASKFNEFMVTKLAEEIKEFRTDRKAMNEHTAKIEKFVMQALANEINEFMQDKKAVVEAKVKLVAEGRKQLNALKAKFVAESSKRIKQAVTSQLKAELTQLKEDIQISRENNFGRKIFETFASEFSVTHLNEKAETRRLLSQLKNKDQQLQESANLLLKAKQLVDNKEREIKIVKEANMRSKVMGELLSSLNREKANTMKNLLEGVETAKLKNAFDKYLPAVLNTGDSSINTQKNRLNESVIKEVTGDKAANKHNEDDGENNLIDFKRLAGL